jgi:ATP-dependent helicase/nuclease subunit A
VVQALDGIVLACDHTRRNAPGVIAGLNTVFNEAEAATDFSGFRPHTTGVPDPQADAPPAWRHLPTEPRSKAARGAADSAWRDTLEVPRTEPETVLRCLEAAHVADAVASWLRGGVAAAASCWPAHGWMSVAAFDCPCGGGDVAADLRRTSSRAGWWHRWPWRR